MDRFRLDDKVAIVTGSGRGIGRAIALGLAEVGAHVVCCARSEAHIVDTVEHIQKLGSDGLAVVADVTDETQVKAVVDQCLQKYGRIDVLVNNAGGSMPSLVQNTSVAELEAAFHFNVSAAFMFSKLCAPHLLASSNAAVVNISSALSHFVESGFVAYGTGKAALNHMTRMMAAEYAPRIRFNALAVGSVETEALAPLLVGELRQQMEALTPLGRLGHVDDVALAALYLATPASSWVSGKIFEIDGGTVASNWPLKISVFD